MVCWNCGESQGLPPRPGRKDLCPKCNSYLRCCLNCKFFDEKAHHQCREPQADQVKNKKGAIFCDYFAANSGQGKISGGKQKLSKEDARKKWDDLFKKE